MEYLAAIGAVDKPEPPPTLPIWLTEHAEAWMILHRLRDGMAPIRATEIEAEARIRGVEDVADFARLIRAMDTEWMSWAQEKQRADAKSRNRR